MTPAQSKAAAKADAKARALAKEANGTESQVNNSPPMVYQAPSINVPASMHEVAALIQGELTKIQQAQSVLLTLYEKFDPRPGGNGARITPEPSRPDAYFEYGSSSTQTYMDIHTPGEPTKADYGARLIAEGGGTYGTNYARLTVQGYGIATHSVQAPVNIRQAMGYRKNDGTWSQYKPVNGGAAARDQRAFTSTDWTVKGVSPTGNTITADMNEAPAGCTYFAYDASTTTNGPPRTGAAIDIYGIDERYRLQIVGEYSGGDELFFRTRNGDSNVWNPWHKLTNATMLAEARAELKAEIYAELMAAGVISELPAPLPQEVGAHE